MDKRLPSGHKAKKRFGQNFLVDESIINHIMRVIRPQANDCLVEIGPGQGALTHQLIQSCPKLHVIELDKDLIPLLLAQFANHSELHIHQADALSFDFKQLVTNENNTLRVVGNLPYNISTPLIFHLLEQKEIIKDMHFMLQKEVVNRLAASPGSKDYGRLSIMAQYHCDIEYLFDVPPESFYPAPKVNSAIVRLAPHSQPRIQAKDMRIFENLVKSAFSQRRKTLKNALKSVLEDETIGQCSIDFSKRAEDLTLEDYLTLANLISDN